MKSVVQVQIFSFLNSFQGPPPTVREIAAEIGRSVSTTHKTLIKLREKGYITWEDSKCRTIRLVQL